MRRLSGSGLKLVETCPASAHGPDIWQESGDAAEAGTGRHAFLFDLQHFSREVALARIPADAPWRKTCESIDVSEIPKGRAEVGFSYDPETGAVAWLPSGRNNEGYDLSIPPHFITGTVDLIVDSERRVIDWKGPERVDDPAINFQVGFYAMAVARLMEWDSVSIGIANIDPSGQIRWHDDVLDVWALADVERRIAATLAVAKTANRADGPYRRGAHCTRCSGLVACPAAMSLVATLVNAPPFDQTGMVSADLARAYEDATIVREALALTQRAVEETVYQTGKLELPGGGSLQIVERPRKSLDVVPAVKVLRELFGVEKVDPLIDMKITNADVEKLAKHIAPPRQGTAFTKELWNRLKVDGLVKEARYKTVSLVRAKRAPGAPEPVEDEE